MRVGVRFAGVIGGGANVGVRDAGAASVIVGKTGRVAVGVAVDVGANATRINCGASIAPIVIPPHTQPMSKPTPMARMTCWDKRLVNTVEDYSTEKGFRNQRATENPEDFLTHSAGCVRMSNDRSMIFFLVFASAFFAALVLTPPIARLAQRTGALDRPAARRIHDHPIPRFGGATLFLAFWIAVAISLTFPRTDPNEIVRLAGLLVGGLILFAIGAVDDHRELKATPQLIAQFVAASIAVASGVVIEEIPNPFGGSIPFQMWFAVLFTLFWLAGMINTINWLDGVDGLAPGVAVIASGVMFVHTYRLQQFSIALLALALIGAVLGFLIYNFYPARIFMGSAGANVLGFTLGVLSIMGGAKVATVLLVLGIPILDVAWQIYNRLRHGKSPFTADRGHLHHRLLDRGLSQRAIVLLYYGLTAMLGALALVLPSGVYKLIALVIIGIGALLILIRLGEMTARRK